MFLFESLLLVLEVYVVRANDDGYYITDFCKKIGGV